MGVGRRWLLLLLLPMKWLTLLPTQFGCTEPKHAYSCLWSWYVCLAGLTGKGGWLVVTSSSSKEPNYGLCWAQWLFEHYGKPGTSPSNQKELAEERRQAKHRSWGNGPCTLLLPQSSGLQEPTGIEPIMFPIGKLSERHCPCNCLNDTNNVLQS